jgi:hypothetical protein
MLCSIGVAQKSGVVDPASYPIIAGEGLGSLKFGADIAAVSRVFGAPERTTGSAMEYLSLGFAVVPNKDNKIAVFFFGCGTCPASDPLIKNCKFKTREGTKLLDSRATVIKAYGQPGREEQGTLIYDSGLEFRIVDDQVVHITAKRRRTQH